MTWFLSLTLSALLSLSMCSGAPISQVVLVSSCSSLFQTSRISSPTSAKELSCLFGSAPRCRGSKLRTKEDSMDLVEGKLQKFVFIDVEGLNNKAFLEISAAFASDRETRFSEFLKKFPAALVVDHVFKSSDEMDSADEVVGGMVEAGMIQNIERVSGVHELFKTLQSMDGNIDGINAVIAHLQVEDLDAMEMQEVYEKILGIDDILVMVSERNQQILAHDQQDSSHLSSRNTIPSLKFERFEGLEDSVDAANATVLNGKYGPYYMTPNILSGILMSLLLVLFLICAINVTLGIKTPTRFPHKPLVIKKEF